MTQAGFIAALLDPDMPVPDGLVDPEGRPAGKRFAVYRNNVAVSLTEALGTAFPVIRKLVGDAFFDAMAGVFLRQHPPTSAVLMFYGDEMPAFLESFPPAQTLRYLPDIARLELALRRSYHAADVAPMAAETLQAMPPDRLMAARLRLAPAVRLIRSDWPIHAIWRANTEDGAPKPIPGAQDTLIMRPGFDPGPHLLPEGGGAVMAALMAGADLGTALEAAEVDMAALFALLLSGGAIVGIQEETT